MTFPTRELTEADVNRINAVGQRKGILAHPFKENAGIEGMQEVLESLHDVEEEQSGGVFGVGGETRNVSPAHSFEIRYARESRESSNRVLWLQYVPGNPDQTAMLERRLSNQYPDSRLKRQQVPFLDARPGQYLAGGTLALRYYTLLPIKNVGLSEWRVDPTNSILSEMVGADDINAAGTDVVVQLLFRPAPRDWLHGVPNGEGVADLDDLSGQSREFAISGTPSVRDLTYQLRQPTYETKRLLPRPLCWMFDEGTETLEHPPSKSAKDIATMLEGQNGKAWEIHARIFAVSDDPDEARARASDTAQMYSNFYEFRSEQTFVPQPYDADEVVDTLVDGATREFDPTGIVQTQTATAGLVNIPTADDISTNKMQWALSRTGGGVPPGTPSFDFSAAGLGSNPSVKEQQLALLNGSDAGDPVWVGTGSKQGREAGIYEEYLDTHMQVTGGTGKGKTTLLTNLSRQFAERDYGGLVIVHGKEEDEDRFIEEFPPDRDDEDFVFIDTGDPDYGTDKRIRFNLLEIPTDSEPGTSEFDSAAESLAEDWAASFAEAGGGSNDYWGPLMDRVTKTVIVGLAKRGKKATPLDVAAACSSSDGLEKFREFMDEERIAFVREQARRVAEKEDADLEPLAGRMDILTRHAGLRNFLCARNPSASIQDLVAEGKWCVLRLDPNLSESETKFMLTPLVRRFYTAKKTCEDAPRFYLIWDEFDKAVSENTNIHELLSIARGYDFRMILSCQAPSNQLYGRLKNAMQNQIDTAISFGTGEQDAKYVASHHTIDADDLSGMGRYKFWMRTYYRRGDEEDKTESYLVNSFPPTREARQDLEGETPRDPDRMKRESAEREGDVPQSAEELQAESQFYDTGGEGDASAETDMAGAQLAALEKATFDAAIRAGDDRDGNGWVDRDAVVELLERRTEDRHLSEVSALVTDSDAVKFRDEPDGSQYLRAPDTDPTDAMTPTGTPTEGGEGHWELLADAYPALTDLGLDVTFPLQGSGREVDAVGRLQVTIDSLSAAETFRDENPVLAALTDGDDVTIEAEKATSKKGQRTLANLEKAVEADQRCLFLCRPEATQRLQTTLTDPPFVSADDGETRRFYNGRNLWVDGTVMLRPERDDPSDSETQWTQEADGTLVLSDGVEELARFDSVAAVFGDADAYPAREDDVPADAVGEGAEWRHVKAPYLPERELPGVGQDAFEILPVDREGHVERVVGEECVPVSEAGTEAGRDDSDSEDDDIPDVLKRRSSD